MKLDFRQVEKKLNRLNMSLPKIVAGGMRAAGYKIIEDSKMKSPRAPFKEGHLWAQHMVDNPDFKINLITLRVGASTPYAARLHEAPETWNFSLTDSGPKYIESKIIKYHSDYLYVQYAFIKNRIKELN